MCAGELQPYHVLFLLLYIVSVSIEQHGQHNFPFFYSFHFRSCCFFSIHIIDLNGKLRFVSVCKWRQMNDAEHFNCVNVVDIVCPIHSSILYRIIVMRHAIFVCQKVIFMGETFVKFMETNLKSSCWFLAKKKQFFYAIPNDLIFNEFPQIFVCIQTTHDS